MRLINSSGMRFTSAGLAPVGCCVLLFLVIAGCARAQTIDLSTDEAVLAELQKRADAKREELGKTGESKPDARRVCIERLKESAKIIIIGGFAYDRGCRLQGAFIDSRYFEADDPALSKNALAVLGWETANQEQREKLALVWVEKGLLPFFTVLYTKDKDLNDRAFQPPQVVSTENGEIKVTLWILLPPGMRREKAFRQVEHRFSQDGNLLGGSTND